MFRRRPAPMLQSNMELMCRRPAFGATWSSCVVDLLLEQHGDPTLTRKRRRDVNCSHTHTHTQRLSGTLLVQK